MEEFARIASMYKVNFIKHKYIPRKKTSRQPQYPEDGKNMVLWQNYGLLEQRTFSLKIRFPGR